MADVDTSNQKHKGKAEQNKAGTGRHLQEDMQRLDEAIRDKWKVKAVHLALELEAVRSEAATEHSIDQLNIVRRYGLSPSNNFVINKYFYLVQGEPEHG